uniref:AB hydrolase-1 domain-containing protein n=1 Tax=Vitrella brassicaformis TaxID=1169539 RepID=A0A7S1P4R7_9ALVE|mmetsp:Transcript_3253/g.7373  ORF Transcript_3253/g.7373 Transcript_3253/m.7373 type:complete len:376 (+) Transcript_3253:155-1282(+)
MSVCDSLQSVAVAVGASLIAVLSLAQDHLIYFKRKYKGAGFYEEQRRAFDEFLGSIGRQPIQDIQFKDASIGHQTAFLIPPRSSRVGTVVSPRSPLRLWVLFGGNAALALDWLEFVGVYLRRRVKAGKDDSGEEDDMAFLLADYPGYGECEGRPTPANTMKTSVQALDACLDSLSRHYSGPLPPIELNVFGHSIGAAAGLQLALAVAQRLNHAGNPKPAYHSISLGRLLLISPFTSLVDMATVVFPIIPTAVVETLLVHKWDNRKRLTSLLDPHLWEDHVSDSAIPLTVMHGDRDEVVPVYMGRELGGLAKTLTQQQPTPFATRYVEFAGADHNTLIWDNMADVLKAMDQPRPQAACQSATGQNGGAACSNNGKL